MSRLEAIVDRASARAEDAPVLLAPGRPPLTWAGLRSLVCATAGALRASGIERGDRVALLVENGPEAASAFLSIAAAATAAPLNPAYGAAELAFYLDDTRASAVVVSAALDSAVREVAAARGIPVLELHADETAAAGLFALDGARSGRPLDEPDRSPDDIALVLHTSGTTSRPKLVPLAHRNLCVSARNVARTLQLEPADRCLNVMPLFHIHGLVAALLASLEAGASIACTPGFHQLRFFDWLEELAPSWYTAVPTMHAAILERAEDRMTSPADHRLRFVRSSSAALPISVLEGLEATFRVPVIEAYGMTEAAHQMASNALPPGVRKPGSVGRAAGPEIAVLDASGRVLPPGEVGEVAIRGPNVFSGYEANPAANRASFSDGWFRTGDEGLLDEDGFLVLRGRLKEIINRGGEKISPLEIDEVLLRHDAVAQAVTFAVADPRLGEEVAAAVVPASGREPEERALQDFVAAQLAPFKVPRRILVLDEIPKGPTGKMQRIGLAERLDVASAAERDTGRPVEDFLVEQLVAIWESVLGVSDVGIDDDFFALGGDSILGAEAVARVRDLVGDPDLPLVSIVRAPTPAGMAREVYADVGAGHSGIVAVQASGTLTPLFLVHDAGGEVLQYAALARRLGADQPLYALRARGVDDGEAMHSSIAEMAIDYVAEVRRLQPHGPYLLGGFCLGGSIAFEMGAVLQASGEDVAMLVLIDPRFPRPTGIRYDVWLARRRARDGGLARSVARRIARAARRAGSQVGERPEPTEIERGLARLREAHRSRPLAVPAAVVLSQDFDRYELPGWYLESLVREPRGWTRLPGKHVSLFLPPSLELLADEVRAALELADGQRRGATSRAIA